MRKICFLILFISIHNVNPCFSENKHEMDSLKIALKQAKEDTTQLKLYIALGLACDIENNLKYAEPALKLADKLLKSNISKAQKEKVIDYKIGALNLIDVYHKSLNKESYNPFNVINQILKFTYELHDTNRTITYLLRKSDQYKVSLDLPKALETVESALNLAKLSKNNNGLSASLTKLGSLFESQNNYTQALEKYQQSLKIRYQLKDSNLIGSNLTSIGTLYGKLKNTSKAIEFFNMAINYYDIYGDITIHNSSGFMYQELHQYDSALVSFKKGLTLSKITGNVTYLWGSYSNVAESYMQLKNYKKALENYKLAMEYAEKSGTSWVGWTNQSFAEFYFNQKDYQKAKIYAQKSLEILNSYQAKYVQYMSLYKTMAKIDSASGNWKSAYLNFQKYIELNNKSNSDELRKAAIKDKLQSEYEIQKAIEKARQDKIDALTKKDAQRKNTILLSVIIGLVIVLIFATFIYRSLGIRKKQNKLIETQKIAIESSYHNLALLNNISNEITSSLNLTSVMELIYKNVSALMDVSFFIISTYDSAEDAVDVKFCVKENEVVPLNFKTYLSDPKSIMTALTVRNKKEIIIQDWAVEYLSYQNEPAQLKDKNDLYCDSMIWIPLLIKDQVIGLFSVQSIKKNAFTANNIEILRSLSSIIAVALNNAEAYHKIDKANIEISAQKHIVEEKQKEILDSIEYALRIQTAILPPQKLIKQHLENSFILYKPKDIVAGDFYWMETVQFENEKQFENLKMENNDSNFQIDKSSNSQIVLFAACDCTGHGVPGAMVSVVCHNALNRAVHEFGLLQPAAILDKTAEIVVENFAKSEEEIKDGMDISLCALNFNKVQNFVKVTLQWAGANNPLWLIRNGDFIETKADKQPIGMDEDHHPFTNHTFNLEQGDTIYIFSDGFADQFSPADKKLMKKNFKNLLLSIQDKNMQEQHDYLNTYIENWKGNMEQTDDILVIGVQV